MGLIEITKAELIRHMKTKYRKYYSLSLNGLHYLIMYDCDVAPGRPIQSIVANYRLNVLFGIFLYPFIKEETLMNLDASWNSETFLDLQIYLQSICESICSSQKTLRSYPNTTEDGNVIQQIFFWLKNNDQQPLPLVSELFLKHFLKKTFKWDWIDEAKLFSDIQEKTIEIKNLHDPRFNSAIRIINDGKTAVLRQNSKKLFEFHIHETDAMISFEIKTSIKRINTVNSQFLEKSRKELLILLTKIRDQFQFSTEYEFIYKDERFSRSLKRMNLKPLGTYSLADQ